MNPREDHSLFNQEPQFDRAVHQVDAQTCHSYNRGRSCVRNQCPYVHLCNQCGEEHRGCSCLNRAPVCNRCGTSQMDHIVPQTSPRQIQTQRGKYKVYTNVRNDQSSQLEMDFINMSMTYMTSIIHRYILPQ